MEEDIREVVELMDEILDDKTVPKNIKRMVQESKELIISDDDLELRKDSAIHALSGLEDDPNVPMFTRTSIWNIISMLEAL